MTSTMYIFNCSKSIRFIPNIRGVIIIKKGKIFKKSYMNCIDSVIMFGLRSLNNLVQRNEFHSNIRHHVLVLAGGKIVISRVIVIII